MTEPIQLEAEVRAAFTERIRAEVARLLADSLEARARVVGADPAYGGTSRRIRQEAKAHEYQAHRHEERAALLRQLAHDGRL